VDPISLAQQVFEAANLTRRRYMRTLSAHARLQMMRVK
jgi:hypothetical protein